MLMHSFVYLTMENKKINIDLGRLHGLFDKNTFNLFENPQTTLK